MSPERTGPVRTCMGCRQRKPALQLVRVEVTDAGELDVSALAGTPTVKRPVVKGSPVAGSGKGLHLCPDLGCVEKALWMLSHSRKKSATRKDARSGPSAGREGGDGPARVWLEGTAHTAQRLIERREAGLRRRRLDASEDERIGAWKVLAARIAQTLQAERVQGHGSHRRG